LIVTTTIAVALLWRWMVPRTNLVISTRGILDRRLGVGWIRWDEIEGAYRMQDGNTDGVRLRVRVTDRLARRLRRCCGRPVQGRVEVPLELDGTSVSGVEILQSILRYGGCEA
jgi:hypothetical protein